jgi:hypothetical protein
MQHWDDQEWQTMCMKIHDSQLVQQFNGGPPDRQIQTYTCAHACTRARAHTHLHRAW